MAELKVELDVGPLLKVGELTHQNLREAIEKLARETVEDAKSRCPVSSINEPGHVHLRDTLEAEVTGELEVTVHDGVPHGIFVEEGTRFMPARPFVQPAIDQARAKLPELVREALEKAGQEVSR